MDAKRELKMHPIEFPTYSPDLNPLDFSLWEEVQNRMNAQVAPKNESATAFMARLRKTALATPEPTVRRMLSNIKARAQAIYEQNGGHIPRD